MATVVSPGDANALRPKIYIASQGFFLGLSLALSATIITGFGQLAVRGITDPIGAPVRVHVHALLLVGWLAVFCSQNWLAFRGSFGLHRKLGWMALVLVSAIVVANYHVTLTVIEEGRLGPQDTPASFLALGTADTLTFAGLIVWAIVRRRQTEWHRRLMFGATLMVAAAGLNRLFGDLPLPLAPLVSIGTQLAFVGAIWWHDRRTLGHVHRATIAVAVMVVVQRSLPFLLPMVPPWVTFALLVTNG